VRYRVHIVEDNAANRELLAEWLDAEGYEVQTSENLREAMAAAERVGPDAVLLDVDLGGEDGLEFAAWLRQRPKLLHVPVIAVTAHAMSSDRERILRAGCNAYVPKPVDFGQLREALHRWLGRSEKGSP
jgi:CheY-like chemotaxis protein